MNMLIPSMECCKKKKCMEKFQTLILLATHMVGDALQIDISTRDSCVVNIKLEGDGKF